MFHPGRRRSPARDRPQTPLTKANRLLRGSPGILRFSQGRPESGADHRPSQQTPIVQTLTETRTKAPSDRRRKPINYMHAVNHCHGNLHPSSLPSGISPKVEDEGCGLNESGDGRGERHADHFECGPSPVVVKDRAMISREAATVVRFAGSWQRDTLPARAGDGHSGQNRSRR